MGEEERFSRQDAKESMVVVLRPVRVPVISCFLMKI